MQPELYPTWIKNATPGDTDKNGVFTPKACYRYAINGTFDEDTSSGQCPSDLFVENITERCYSWVYDTMERTIVQEVSMLLARY